MIVTTTKIKLMKTDVFEKDPMFSGALNFTCKWESDLIFLCLSFSLLKISSSFSFFLVSYIMAKVG